MGKGSRVSLNPALSPLDQGQHETPRHERDLWAEVISEGFMEEKELEPVLVERMNEYLNSFTHSLFDKNMKTSAM